MTKHSLESRLCLLVAGLLFALLLVVGQVQLSAQRSAMAESQEDKYQSISSMLAIAYGQTDEKGQSVIYSDLVTRLMGSDRDISYVLVTDQQKHVRFASLRDCSKPECDSLVGQSVQKVIKSMPRYGVRPSTENEKVVLAAYNKQKSPRTIEVGFTPRFSNYATECLESNLFATFAAAFLVGILGAILLAKTIVGPIRELTHAAQDVSNGNLEAWVDTGTGDELGELGRTFNTMVVALKNNRERLIQRANTDSLTDLFNHRCFQERLSSELSRATRYSRPLSIIMMDIDHFKNLNDTYGHPFGDAVLQQVGRLLMSEARDIDVVARYGGEEFALILPETHLNDAMVMADRLRLAIQRHCFADNGGQCVPVTISLGAAEFPVHSAEREGLIMAADLAMYQSKSRGRNRATAYTSDIRNENSADPYKLYLLLHAKDLGTIEAMAAAVDAKGQRPPGFSHFVMRHCLSVSQELGLSDNEQGDVRIAGLLHDIGKLGIPESILTKQGPLTAEERRMVEGHPSLGYSIVQKSPHLQAMLPGILHHHERWDGTGYPHGLKGSDIPMIARIISVVDAFHAMTTDRPQAKAMSHEDARSELVRCSGSQFDPDIVSAFLNVLTREEESGHRTRSAA